MSLSVGVKMRQMAADGYFGVRDLKAAVNDMRDGRGITKREKSIFRKNFRAFVADRSVRVTDGAQDAFRRLLKHELRGYSQKTRAFAPNLSDSGVRAAFIEARSGYISSTLSGGGSSWYGSRSAGYGGSDGSLAQRRSGSAVFSDVSSGGGAVFGSSGGSAVYWDV